jgi:NAD-dependent deacetylase
LVCGVCGSLIRPDIVWFGETLATDILSKIYEAVETCDIFFAIGTSGLVYPAAGLLDGAKQHGAYTVVINPDPGTSGNAALFCKGKASEILGLLDSALRGKCEEGAK